MEEYGESKEYPRGRGYGNDYMRGGEVFGGYGYRERADYDRPRGESSKGQGTDQESGDGDGAERTSAPRNPHDDMDGHDADGEGAVERFPQDERAGGWDVPHDFPEGPDAPSRDAATSPGPTPEKHYSNPDESAAPLGADAPEPIIEHTFGDTGGNLGYSRSYYVTQAQLLQRLYDREE